VAGPIERRQQIGQQNRGQQDRQQCQKQISGNAQNMVSGLAGLLDRYLPDNPLLFQLF
jgi:hypothetical protein